MGGKPQTGGRDLGAEEPQWREQTKRTGRLWGQFTWKFTLFCSFAHEQRELGAQSGRHHRAEDAGSLNSCGVMLSGEKTSEFPFLGWTFSSRKFDQCRMEKKNLTLHLRIRNHDVLKRSKKKSVLYNRPHVGKKKKKRLKILLPWRWAQIWVLTALPPLHSRPRALAAAARLAGALWAREKLGHELGHVRKLRVGAQHVHGLFYLLQRDKRNGTWAGRMVDRPVTLTQDFRWL